MGGVINVTDATFEDEVLQASTPVVLDLWGDWCEPCKALDPVVQEIARVYGGRLKVCRMDVGENPRVASAYHVMTLPTLLFIDQGQVVGQHVGTMRAEVLSNQIEERFQLVAR